MPRLAVISDTNAVTTARLTRMVVEHDPRILLFAGDHHPTRFGVTRWSARSWRRSIGVPLKDSVIAVPGNHDYDRTTGLNGWFEAFDPLWPAEAHREGGSSWFLATLWDVRIIGLDTGPFADEVSDEQLAWLEALDPARVRPPVIALAHSPLAPVSLHIGRAQDHDPDRRDRLVAALSRLGVRLYLCGHEHLYAHRLIPGPNGDIHQLTLGGGGATSYQVMTPDVVHAVSEPHVALVDPLRDGVMVTVLDSRGHQIDVVRAESSAPRGSVRRATAEHAAAEEPPSGGIAPPY
ncbi:MAG: metallophosphoesterase [Thermoleophilia bacterium]